MKMQISPTFSGKDMQFGPQLRDSLESSKFTSGYWLSSNTFPPFLFEF